jgi:plastocyanin
LNGGGAGPNTLAAGIAVSVVIVAAVASIGFFQFNFARSYFPSSTAATSTGPPPKGTYVNVTIPSGASAPSGAPGYSPDKITVVIGKNSTVWWTNADAAAHTVTQDGSSPIFNSGNLDSGQTYFFNFTIAGTYTYHCAYHPWMTGSVTVVAKK